MDHAPTTPPAVARWTVFSPFWAGPYFAIEMLHKVLVSAGNFFREMVFFIIIPARVNGDGHIIVRPG